MDPALEPWLTAFARRALVAAVHGAPPPAPELDGLPEPLAAALAAPAAAFVSLHDASGRVRGCVGTTLADRPLWEVVREMARAAALRDPRFAPVSPAELPGLSVELSLLERPQPLQDLAELRLGEHGLLVVGRGRRGLLLPQVAAEQGWDATTFAEETCKKAGLPRQAYLEPGVSLYRFGARVIPEPAAPPRA